MRDWTKYDISLKLLFERKIISSRALTVCKEIYTKPTLRDAIIFYKLHGTFIKVRNCGLATNEELTRMCKSPYLILDKLHRT